ncbi:MAG: HAD-IC family P-type ATPase, partial [Dehalococcoidia bacterium]
AVRLYLGPGQAEIAVTGVGYEPTGEFLRDGTPVDAGDAHLRLLLVAAALCNDAHLQQQDGRWQIIGDTTEGALAVAAAKAGLAREQVERQHPRVDEAPFTAARRRMTTVHRWDHGLIAFQKGAPDVVLDCCDFYQDGSQRKPLSDGDRAQLRTANVDLASRGLRVLALASRPIADEEPREELEQGLTFLGLVALEDPPRPEAKDAVALCGEAGIQPVMITGDHAGTALAIARQLAIANDGDEALTGAELDNLSDAELQEAAHYVRVYARISPEQKVRIVEALRANGHIVAVTGDGVNDAPALKRAHIGVAMGITGTDVAKDAADMIITDDNFASIVAAVEEGRKIFDNIRNFVVYLMSANIGEVILIFGGIAAGLPIPLLAMQILWVNLVTDSLPALALSFEPGDPDAMRRR